MAERLPPSRRDSELAVLAACLLDPTGAAGDEAAQLLTADDFADRRHALVWRALRELDAGGRPPDVVMLTELLRARGQLEAIGGSPFLAELILGPVVVDVSRHAQEIADAARVRRMIRTLQDALAGAYEQHPDVIEWAQRVARDVSDVAAHKPRDPAEALAVLAPRVLEEAAARGKHGAIPDGLETGWSDYTRKIGGWKRGKLHVVGGRPGMGKTAFLLGAALNVAAQGWGVVFISAEMDKTELAQRAVASVANVNAMSFGAGQLSADEWSHVTSAADQLRGYPLIIKFSPGAQLAEIRSTVRSEQRALAQSGYQLGMVVVDYLQILNGLRESGQSREEEVARLVRGLTWLAGELGVVMLVASQINRAVESRANKSKRPQLSELRESGSIEQDAYTVTLLYRDEYYHRESEWAGTLECIVAKNRGGPTGSVRLAFIAESLRIENLAVGQGEFEGLHDDE